MAGSTGLEPAASCVTGRRSKVLGKMAGSTGLEPAASCVTGRRSNQLNYDPGTWGIGGRYKVRTCDLRLVRPLLSQLS